jgi:hypothetical protein
MYKKKCLFRNTNGTYGREASAVESVWAYLFGAEEKKTGRYRIRITKMSAQELIAMGLAPEETPADFYGLQASLDKWNESIGWLPLFDWVGDPNSEITNIEKDLGNQFQSFITGLSIKDDFGFESPVSPKPKKPKIKLPKKQTVEEKTKESPPTDEENPGEVPDFEWL